MYIDSTERRPHQSKGIPSAANRLRVYSPADDLQTAHAGKKHQAEVTDEFIACPKTILSSKQSLDVLSAREAYDDTRGQFCGTHCYTASVSAMALGFQSR